VQCQSNHTSKAGGGGIGFFIVPTLSLTLGDEISLVGEFGVK
jgi:hypothetical protein